MFHSQPVFVPAREYLGASRNPGSVFRHQLPVGTPIPDRISHEAPRHHLLHPGMVGPHLCSFDFSINLIYLLGLTVDPTLLPWSAMSKNLGGLPAPLYRLPSQHLCRNWGSEFSTRGRQGNHLPNILGAPAMNHGVHKRLAPPVSRLPACAGNMVARRARGEEGASPQGRQRSFRCRLMAGPRLQ